MRLTRSHLFVCLTLTTIFVCNTRVSATTISTLVARARPGQTVRIPPGTYIEDVIVPPGISIAGRGADKTLIVGSLELSGTPDHPVSLSNVHIIHTGGGSTVAVQCGAGVITIHHSFVSSEGGFAAIGAGNCTAVVRNNIIVGPVGNYAIFGRGGGSLEIVNNTIVVQGFGVGLMDRSVAQIRNCMFHGPAKPAVIRTGSDYTISFTNISLTGSSYYFAYDLVNNDVHLPPPKNKPLPESDANKDVSKYDSPGLSFLPHEVVKYRSVRQYKQNQPDLARHAGSLQVEDRNADGTRNDLGAFGGPEGAKWR